MADYTILQKQIFEEAEQEARQIEEKAKERLEMERDQAHREVETQVEQIRSHAQKQIPLIEERVSAEAERNARNQMLSAKQDMVDQIFEEAEERLLHLSEKEWKDALERYLKTHPLPKDAILEIPQGRNYTLPSGKVEKASDLQSGFRVRKDGVTENYDFPEVLRYLRRSLEQEVVRSLTEGEG